MPTHYLEHLTESDVRLLAQVAGVTSPGRFLEVVRQDAHLVSRLLRQPAMYDLLFGRDVEAFARASPFLTFAVLTHRGASELAQARFVEEWIAPGRRVPSFAVDDLRAFLDDDARRLYLAELLASFTRVASGSFWVQSGRGWRRKRYSDLDPIRLMELLEELPEHARPPVYRRLGDLTLFLTGVFPDYAGGRLLHGARRRLHRYPLLRDDRMDSGWPRETSHDMDLLERLGSRSYRLALEGADRGAPAQVLAEFSQGFGRARRLLNFLTGSYLFPHRDAWYSLT
jgi:hypothetical protein